VSDNRAKPTADQMIHTPIAAPNSGSRTYPGESAEHQCRDNAEVQDHVAAVMQFVGADRYGSGAAHDAALVKYQSDRHHDREHHDYDAERRVGNRGRFDQPAHRFGEQQQRAAGDKGGLAQHRQRLGLAVAKAMLAVGRRHRVSHGEEIDHRSYGVEQ
jgi:hypothetical protein